MLKIGPFILAILWKTLYFIQSLYRDMKTTPVCPVLTFTVQLISYTFISEKIY